jgi:hypothetical protein
LLEREALQREQAQPAGSIEDTYKHPLDINHSTTEGDCSDIAFAQHPNDPTPQDIVPSSVDSDQLTQSDIPEGDLEGVNGGNTNVNINFNKDSINASFNTNVQTDVKPKVSFLDFF